MSDTPEDDDGIDADQHEGAPPASDVGADTADGADGEPGERAGSTGDAGDEPTPDPDEEVPSGVEPAGADPGDEGADPDEALDGIDVDVDPEELPDDPFTEMEAGEVDEEAVWTELAGDDEPVADEPADEVVVPKRKYCERCEHFSPPPEVACGHEGTDILELVDMEHFRVSNCPVVAERRQIGATDIREE